MERTRHITANILTGHRLSETGGRKVFFDFSLTVKAAPHECVIRTGQPLT